MILTLYKGCCYYPPTPTPSSSSRELSFSSFHCPSLSATCQSPRSEQRFSGLAEHWSIWGASQTPEAWVPSPEIPTSWSSSVVWASGLFFFFFLDSRGNANVQAGWRTAGLQTRCASSEQSANSPGSVIRRGKDEPPGPSPSPGNTTLGRQPSGARPGCLLSPSRERQGCRGEILGDTERQRHLFCCCSIFPRSGIVNIPGALASGVQRGESTAPSAGAHGKGPPSSPALR